MAAAEELGLAGLSDEGLVERVRGGDYAAFDALYRRYFARIYRFLDRRLSNRADVEETVQEVFINLFSSLDSFRGEAPFAAWTFGLTRRTLANRFKRKRAATVPFPADEAELGEESVSQNDTSADPHLAYELNERLERLQRGVDDLSSDQWELFRLRHLENRSIEEIAQQLAKSEDAVKSHLYRARKVLLAR
jgi:RNA polymerase sigma-70 factor (ECF subfamily)